MTFYDATLLLSDDPDGRPRRLAVDADGNFCAGKCPVCGCAIFARLPREDTDARCGCGAIIGRIIVRRIRRRRSS